MSPRRAHPRFDLADQGHAYFDASAATEYRQTADHLVAEGRARWVAGGDGRTAGLMEVSTGTALVVVSDLDGVTPDWEASAEFDRLALEAPGECGRDLTVGPHHDPYGTACDLEPHGPEVKHEGPDPFGAGGRVRWHGGGTIAGDRVPARDLEWVPEEETT